MIYSLACYIYMQNFHVFPKPGRPNCSAIPDILGLLYIRGMVIYDLGKRVQYEHYEITFNGIKKLKRIIQ